MESKAMNNQISKRLLSLVLAAVMVFGNAQMPVLAMSEATLGMSGEEAGHSADTELLGPVTGPPAQAPRIIFFEPFDDNIKTQTVPFGTLLAEVNLPAALTAIVEGVSRNKY